MKNIKNEESLKKAQEFLNKEYGVDNYTIGMLEETYQMFEQERIKIEVGQMTDDEQACYGEGEI